MVETENDLPSDMIASEAMPVSTGGFSPMTSSMYDELPEIVKLMTPVDPELPNVVLSAMLTTALEKKGPPIVAVASACVTLT